MFFEIFCRSCWFKGLRRSWCLFLAPINIDSQFVYRSVFCNGLPSLQTDKLKPHRVVIMELIILGHYSSIKSESYFYSWYFFWEWFYWSLRTIFINFYVNRSILNIHVKHIWKPKLIPYQNSCSCCLVPTMYLCR